MIHMYQYILSVLLFAENIWENHVLKFLPIYKQHIFNAKTLCIVHLSSSSCAMSVADIIDHGLPILSVASTDELIVRGFFPSYLVIQTVYFLHCLPLLLVPHIFPNNMYFSNPSALFIGSNNCSCLFLVVFE